MKLLLNHLKNIAEDVSKAAMTDSFYFSVV